MIGRVLEITLGNLNRALLPLCIIMLVNILAAVVSDPSLPVLITNLKRVLGYLIFIILGNQIDHLAVDALFGWQGSTQFLVTISLVGMEFKDIFEQLEKLGLKIPAILLARAKQLQDPPASSESIDDKILKLKRELEKLEQTKVQAEGGSNNDHQSTDVAGIIDDPGVGHH